MYLFVKQYKKPNNHSNVKNYSFTYEIIQIYTMVNQKL